MRDAAALRHLRRAAPPRRAAAAPPRTLRPALAGCWSAVAIEVVDGALTVVVDGAAVFERAPLPGWRRPRVELWLRHRFGEPPTEDGGAADDEEEDDDGMHDGLEVLAGELRRAVAAGEMSGEEARARHQLAGEREDVGYHRIDNVRVDRGASLHAAPVELALTLNGQQYAAGGVFTYHAHPLVTELRPPNGPAAGGTALTLLGEALSGAERYSCRSPSAATLRWRRRGATTATSAACGASPTRAEIAAHSADWTPEKIATYWPTGPHNPAGCADPDGCVTRAINPDYRPTLDLRLRVWRDGLELWPRSTAHFEMTPTATLQKVVPASRRSTAARSCACGAHTRRARARRRPCQRLEVRVARRPPPRSPPPAAPSPSRA